MEIDSYCDTSESRFHGPNDFEPDYAGITNYFNSIREAFHDRSIRRGTILAGALRSRFARHGRRIMNHLGVTLQAVVFHRTPRMSFTDVHRDQTGLCVELVAMIAD